MIIRVYEADGQQQALDQQVKDLKQDKDMASLVDALNGLTDDQLDLLELGFGDGALATEMETENMPIKAKDLHPTQNEIDVGKSLDYQLNPADPEMTKKILSGGPVQFKSEGKDAPLVVYNYKGKYYIVDGHHRWSQVYMLNPGCEIDCIVFKNSAGNTEQDPVDMLRDFQGAIAVANKGKVPSSTVTKGMNIFDEDTWTDEHLTEYIDGKITDKMIKAYCDYYDADVKGSNIAKALVANAGIMRQFNQPVPGAPSRAVMPQTNVGGNAGLEVAKRGMTDI